MPRLSKIGAAALAAFGWTSGNAAVTASYLVVAGGGSGGSAGGGGGAGGLLSGTVSLNPTLSYTVTVGAGAAARASGSSTAGTVGSNSVFSTITSTGGGGGASDGAASSSGGSGGGGAQVNGASAGTSGQGFAGGAGSNSAPNYGSGGGGGASAVGSAGSSTVAGAGGAGTASSISGSSVTYAGGGGGGSIGGTAGAGGSGGGGAGSSSSTSATSGTANTGGGGGGGGYAGAYGQTGAGGSGIVIISYVGAQQFSGGVVTSSGGNTIHTFTTSGTLGPVTPLSANYLVVAGGGSGGAANGGGGGAGGLLSGSSLTIDPYSTYVVTVGAGGSGASYITGTGGVNGSNSAFSMLTTSAIGGGRGGSFAEAASSGGSGGGSSNGTNTGGAGTSLQGNKGGNTSATGPGNFSAAGGGGAGAAGADISGGASASNGGVGLTSSISGTSTYYAGGGGGGTNGGTTSSGGLGGGGAGAVNLPGTAGTANTGGGGGGSAGSNNGASGGSGVVIISYAGSTQLMAGGVVTIAGGNVIHTFNSSGYLTPLTLLTRSLRFRGAYPTAPSYLSRTAGTPTNNLKWTYSLWVKRGVLGVGQFLLNGGTGTSASEDYLAFFASDKLSFGQANASSTYLLTASVYRDPAAWYHIVFVYDSAQATASNRALFYVNGVQVTSFSNATYPTLNQATNINASGVLQRISSRTYAADEGFDGYMAEVNFIDGQALAPTAFGTVNSYGVWQPITYGGSYGTNGFRLPFTNNASTTTLGYDFSPQGNNWTATNISVTAGVTYDSMTDVPTLTSATAANFCTLNPLYPSSIPVGGNLNVVGDSNSRTVAGTMSSPTGKYYAEGTFTSGFATNGWFFVWDTSTPYVAGNVPATTGQTGAYYAGITGNIVKAITGTTTTIGTYSTWTNSDIIGMAFDADAGTISFYKNNTLQVTITDSAFIGRPLTFGIYYYAGSASMNFGQRPFAYTPPSGYLALNTFNL